MNTREIAAEYRLAHWADIMKDRLASDLSVKDFCKTAGFHENVYYYWQRKLREAAGSEKSLVPNGWTICESAGPTSKGSSLAIEIGGYRLHVEAETDPELLAKVCRVLKALC